MPSVERFTCAHCVRDFESLETFSNHSPCYSTPTVERFETVTKVQPWGTETLVAHGPTYTGKVLHYRAGHCGPLQHHVEKDETFYLYQGRAVIDYEEDGALVSKRIYSGESFHVPPGAVHRFAAIIDCYVFEASNPVFEDRVNDGARFGVDGEAR